MKKLIATGLLLTGSFFLKAQCHINALASSMSVGETLVLSLNEKATCKEAHHWKVSGTGLQVIGGISEDKLLVRATGEGTATVQVNYISPAGLRQCETNIVVTAPGAPKVSEVQNTVSAQPTLTVSASDQAPNSSKLMVPCTITTTRFTEVRKGETMFSFVPEGEEAPNTTYTWSVLRSDGKEITSTDRIGIFDNPTQAYIMRVKLVIQNPVCKRELSKIYHQNYLSVLPF